MISVNQLALGTDSLIFTYLQVFTIWIAFLYHINGSSNSYMTLKFFETLPNSLNRPFDFFKNCNGIETKKMLINHAKEYLTFVQMCCFFTRKTLLTRNQEATQIFIKPMHDIVLQISISDINYQNWKRKPLEAMALKCENTTPV